MVKKQITVRLTPEQEQFFKENFQNLSGKDIFDALIDNYQNPPEIEKTDVSGYTRKISELEAELEAVRSDAARTESCLRNDLTAENEALTLDNERLDSEIAQKNEQIAELQRQYENASGYLPKENELRFEIPQLQRTLLNETTKRLSQKFKKAVSEKDVLLDLFIRYTVEQYAEIDSFPFVIKKSELKELTGYSEKEIVKWLNAK
jgi:chromosome segregation ATPase